MTAPHNIILMICHDLGRHLGCFGVKGIDTPNIDEFARDGILFDNYFCTAAQCSPSRGSIITGQLPHNNGLMGLAHLGWELHEEVMTLPKYLDEHGYDTHLFGLQHETANGGEKELGYRHIGAGGSASKVAEAVSDFIIKRQAPNPFFASVGFWEPHRPYDSPEYTPDPPNDVDVPPYLPDTPGVRLEISQLQGMVRAMDEAVGQILKALDEAGKQDSTLVIFTTDHGIAMPRAKGTLYDPGIGTALIMQGPDLPQGVVESSLLSNVDLLPTILEYGGLPPLDDIDGYSFLPLLKGKPYHRREHIFVEMTWHDRYNPMRGIRTDRYKYLRNFGKRPLVYIPADIYDSPSGKAVREEYYKTVRPVEELYDLKSDPKELHNIIDEPKYQDIAKSLQSRLTDWLEQTNDPLLKGPISGKNEPAADYWHVVDNNSPFE